MEQLSLGGMTVEQKFAKAMLQLRIIRPFYSAVYEVIEKHANNSIPTIGVSTNELVYNEEFVDKTEFSEFIFIILHEVAHIALQHSARRENRHPLLWNVAADLYINQMLSEEFNIKPGQRCKFNGIDITMPMNGQFCSSIDINVDYTELIYEELYKQAKKNGFIQGEKSGNGQGKGQGQGGQGHGGQGRGQGQGYTFTYTGSKGTDRYDSDQNSTYKQTIKANDPMDIINVDKDQAVKNQESEKVVTDALVRVEMSSTDCGEGSSGLMGMVKNMLKSELDWKKLLRKYLIAATSTDSSFSRPDKRMYHQSAIYPGQVDNEENTVKGIKVCIDTSGSISDEDIEYFCGQVYDLTKQFKIEAELVYWDTSVQSTGEFEGYKEFERVNLIGRGGTDPSVVFNYFDTKKCKVKPIVTLMFTDAYFSTDGISNKQRKKYKDTIWIMTRQHDKDFKPPFGKKALAKFS